MNPAEITFDSTKPLPGVAWPKPAGPYVQSVVDNFTRLGGGVPVAVLLELDVTSLRVRAWDLNHVAGHPGAIPLRLVDGSGAYGVPMTPTRELVHSAIMTGGAAVMERYLAQSGGLRGLLDAEQVE
jgi:hypothetical protein